MLLKELIQGITHLFYPRLCEGCQKPLQDTEQILCLACSFHIPRTSYHHIPDNETAMRFAGRVPFINASSFAYFSNEGLLQHLLHGLKYGNKKTTGGYLGRLLGRELKEAGWCADMQAIIPVPLHPKKEQSRGYNQSKLIAAGMGSIMQVPVYDKILLRSRHTDSQTQKTRSERVSNMQHAFAIQHTEQLAGKHVLLVDDVLTTGATLEACAHSLLTVKDIRISIATIGIAV